MMSKKKLEFSMNRIIGVVVVDQFINLVIESNFNIKRQYVPNIG